uniref:DUF1488 domain-containing protein n=1 Tax=Mesocestoides corti TaxID=53468 RepID=A0A5K3G771_MESCO
MKNYTPKQPLMINYEPEPCATDHPTESTTPLIIYRSSVVSFSGWLPSFPACHWIAERHGIG